MAKNNHKANEETKLLNQNKSVTGLENVGMADANDCSLDHDKIDLL